VWHDPPSEANSSGASRLNLHVISLEDETAEPNAEVWPLTTTQGCAADPVGAVALPSAQV